MSETAAFSGNPNSANQRWSRWTFGIEANKRKCPSMQDVIENGRRFFKQGFGSVGRVRCSIRHHYYEIVVEVEGPPAHDPEYARAVKMQFENRFMALGFGHGARLVRFEVGLLAGSHEDGTPPDQLLVLPHLNLRQLLAEG